MGTPGQADLINVFDHESITVTASSPRIGGASLAEATKMFGAVLGYPEPTQTIFADGWSLGTVHWVQFHTHEPVTVGLLRVIGTHSHAGTPWRSFDRLRLLMSDDGGSTYTQVVLDESITIPYVDQPGNDRASPEFPGRLDVMLALPGAVEGQYFRAEFTQGSSSWYGGPRVNTLAAFVPEPGTLGLLGMALVMLLFRSRPRGDRDGCAASPG